MKKKEDGSTSPSPAASSAPRISPEEIQAKEFRIARFRGYKERDVDEFLDQLTLAWGSVLEENRRLREGSMPLPPGAPATLGGDAEGVVARAREEADRIVREARERAAAIEAGVGSGNDRRAVSAFLGKEREFLQSLAGLVQGHAEGVKGMAREVFASREGPSAPPPTAEAPAAPTPAEEPTATSEPEAVPEPEPIRVEEPEPVAVSREAEPRADGDRSLRELFWGEE